LDKLGAHSKLAITYWNRPALPVDVNGPVHQVGSFSLAALRISGGRFHKNLAQAAKNQGSPQHSHKAWSDERERPRLTRHHKGDPHQGSPGNEKPLAHSRPLQNRNQVNRLHAHLRHVELSLVDHGRIVYHDLIPMCLIPKQIPKGAAGVCFESANGLAYRVHVKPPSLPAQGLLQSAMQNYGNHRNLILNFLCHQLLRHKLAHSF